MEANTFIGLLDNKLPNGKNLTTRMASHRRPGYDFTFDVPKSVSLLHMLTQDTGIVEAMRFAVQQTMEEIEKDMYTRVRKQGAFEDRKTGNMIWADFTHLTTRPAPIPAMMAKVLLEVNPELKKYCNRNGVLHLPDPHLHQHIFVVNLGR